MASCGGEILEDSSGDKKLAFVPGRKPKDMSETIIAVVKTESERASVGAATTAVAGDGGNGLRWRGMVELGNGIDCD